jgi:tRNA(fMet)-specific endonuclease VapC
MPVEFLLDSTWLVEYLRGNARYVQAIQERRTAGLAMSVVTLAELFSGVARSTDREKAEREVRRILSEVQVLGLDEAVARAWGEEDARLTLAGQKIGDLDLFIAATALAHKLTLCSQNRKHFERVPGLRMVSL